MSGKKYVMVRMPVKVYSKYKTVKGKMEKDLFLFTGKPQRLTMPKVFNAVINPQFNRNFIEVDLKKLRELAKSRRQFYD